MKLLLTDRFYKTVPKGKEQVVNKRISYLIMALEENHCNFEAVPNGLGLRKVESVNPRIYKFKISGGDRILCSKGEFINPNIEKEYKNSLVLLEYSNHDSQIRDAKNRNFSNQELSVRALPKQDVSDPIVVQKNRIHNYSLNAPTTIIKNIHVDKEQLINVFGDEGNFYYLDSEQKKLVDITDVGQFVFGSAGSGKTTISVYKIIQFLERAKDSKAKIAYFTFSNKLKEQTETLFGKIATDIYNIEQSDFKDKVEFYTVEEYLEKTAPLDGKIITYEKFKVWFETQNSSSRFDPVGLWKERRGIFQGMIGADWQHSMDLPARQFDNEILDYLSGKDGIEIDKNNATFRLRIEMNAICSLIESEFGDSESFRSKITSEYNQQISSKKELPLTEYYSLKDRDSLYLGDERKKAVNVFKRFGTYVKQKLQREGLYEEGDLVRSAIQNSFPVFDYVIIDEVQDLTEIQVYYLCQLLKQKSNVFVCGDFHQTINPTFFNVGRIESIFKFLGGLDNFEKGKLEKNYRSSKNIVEFANAVSLLRKESIATKEDFNYIEKPLREGTRKPYLFKGDKDSLWNYVKDKSYLYVVVGTEQTKQQLKEEFPDLESRIMTVTEIKGIENRYIITYNILSDHKKQWREIFTQLKSKTKLKSEVYRYYFNVVYVSITRARDVLGMVEDDLPESVSNWLMDKVEVMPKFDVHLLGLQEQSSFNDQLKNAVQLEHSEIFDQAIATYKIVIKSENETLKNVAEIGIKRCEAKKECKSTKDYALCGERLLALNEYDEAIQYLQKGKNAKALLRAILLSNSTERYDLNKEMDRFKTNPLKVLVEMNDEKLTTRFVINEINPFEHQYNELVRKSSKLVKTLVKK